MNKRSIFLIVFGILSLFLVSCNNEQNSPFARIYKNRLITAEHQDLVLRGVNLIDKNKKDNFLPHFTSKTYAMLKDKGYNCVRIQIKWSTLETSPLKYNEDYLQQLDEQIRLVKAQNMYVILTMNPDINGVTINNLKKAEWAETKAKLPYSEIQSILDYDGIKNSGESAIVDNFWANRKSKELKKSLQDYYIQTWKLIAKRYTNETSVLGYDIMSSPFAGSKALEAIDSICEQYSRIDSTYTSESFRKEWESVKTKNNILAKLTSDKNYKTVLGCVEKFYQNFETTTLQPFYQNAAKAIRDVDKNHILFIEPSISAGNGVHSLIRPTLLKDGKPDLNAFLTAHLFDLNYSDDSPGNTMNEDQIKNTLTELEKTAGEAGLPLFISEWGNFIDCDNCDRSAAMLTSLFETYKLSNVYNFYEASLWHQTYFNEMRTAYPQKINGQLLSYKNNGRTCTINWIQKNNSPSFIYIPDTDKVESIDCEQNPETDIRSYYDSKSGYLKVLPVQHGKKGVTIKLVISLR